MSLTDWSCGGWAFRTSGRPTSAASACREITPKCRKNDLLDVREVLYRSSAGSLTGDPLNRTDSIVVATPTSVTVLLSGGLDSTACLAFYLGQGFAVEGLFFDFGQASATQEEDAATAISRYYKAGLRRVRCEGLHPPTGVEVSGRNGFLLLGALMALQSEAGIIGIGMHEGTSYVDCTENFIQASQHLFDLYTDGQVKIGAPFVKWSKRQIWDYGRAVGIPVALTYSCELGRRQPCGDCLSCKDLAALYAC